MSYLIPLKMPKIQKNSNKDAKRNPFFSLRRCLAQSSSSHACDSMADCAASAASASAARLVSSKKASASCGKTTPTPGRRKQKQVKQVKAMCFCRVLEVFQTFQDFLQHVSASLSIFLAVWVALSIPQPPRAVVESDRQREASPLAAPVMDLIKHDETSHGVSTTLSNHSAHKASSVDLFSLCHLRGQEGANQRHVHLRPTNIQRFCQ